MKQMTRTNEQQLGQKKIAEKELSKAFWIYQLGCGLSNSYERLQSLASCASAVPVIKEPYADDEEQQREALRRHSNFFNTEGTVEAPIQGTAIVMGGEKSNGAVISGTAITSAKTGLMGPLAGIGDSIIWTVLIPLVISIFTPMAKGDNVTGSIGPLALCTVITLYINWTLMNKSYALGRNPTSSSLKDGKIKQVIYSVNVSGMIMMGALSASYVKTAGPVTFKVTGGTTIILQDISDRIMKGLLPLAAVMATYFFMVKRGPRYGIIIGTVVLVSLVVSSFGLL